MWWTGAIAVLVVLPGLELWRVLRSRAAERRAELRWAGYVENHPDAGVMLVEIAAVDPDAAPSGSAAEQPLPGGGLPSAPSSRCEGRRAHVGEPPDDPAT